MSKPQAYPRDKVGAFIYLQPPTSQPTRYELVKYATWRMRLYQQLQSLSFEQLKNKMTNKSADQIFPKLCQTAEEKQFYMDIFQQMTQTFEQDLVSYFICLMLYSRDLKNNDFFIKMEKNILSIKLNKMTPNPSTMNIIKNLISSFAKIPVQELSISRDQFQQFQSRIVLWQEKNKEKAKDNIERIYNQTTYMKIPFEHAEAGLKKRRSYVHKGYVYVNIQTAIDIVQNLYFNYLKERVLKVRVQTQKLLQNDIENQLKPFMDKAISSISTATIQQSELNSEFKLNIKNIQAVQKNYFPPCMLNLNTKLRQNKHLKHQGRRQLWLFFKGCGMNVEDNKQYFYRYLSTSVSNSDLKSHMYNIEHAYGLVGKKESQRPKICRTIITSPDPKKDQHHGCPFKHWNKENLTVFLKENYTLNQQQLKKIITEKQQNSFQVACGRLFEQNFKPSDGSLPQQITAQLGKSPHQYFIAGMQATQWINTKTLRPMKTKPVQNQKMELQF